MMAVRGSLMMPRWKNVRDIVLFVAGLAGVFHETVMAATERPTLLLMFAAMMGLPAFLRTDEKDRDEEEQTKLDNEGIELMKQAIEDQRRKNGR